MDSYSEKDREFLINLARMTIQSKNKEGIILDSEAQSINSSLKEKRGAFVTLNKNGNLRGCIGYILPMLPLYQTVIENSYNAAFKDPRFAPVTMEELKDIKIEISILTLPKKVQYNGGDDLLAKLNPNKDGVIIKKGFYSATFLPQVWEQLPKREDFLSHLCAKAGLEPNQWQKGDLDVEVYNAIILEE